MKQPWRIFFSDHALLRYLERVLQVDVEALRAKLLEQLKAAAEAGATTVTVDGFKFCIATDPQTHIATVTTVHLGKRKKA